MSQDSSEKSVIAALAVNTILTIVKGVAFQITGSGAMLSEAIHSFADVMNQTLLFVGIKRAKKTPDIDHPFGYLRERFAWALMSAVGIFFLGCGFTIMHGIEALEHPEPLKQVGWAVGVLSLSLVLDLVIFVYAFRNLWKQKGETPFVTFLKTEADPPEVAVLLEDGAACLGVLIALTAIGLSTLTGSYIWDPVGSICIGTLLGVVALWLIKRNLELLAGPPIPENAQEKLNQVIEASPLIGHVKRLRTMAVDTNNYEVNLEISLRADRLSELAKRDVASTYPTLVQHEKFDPFAEAFTRATLAIAADEIDRIEQVLAEKDPAFNQVDIELDHERKT